MSETQTEPADLQLLLQEALADEDRRLDALEARLAELHARRQAAQAEPEQLEPELEEQLEPEFDEPLQEDPASGAEAPELGEARRLLAESGIFLRHLQERLEELEEQEGLEAQLPPDPIPLPPVPVAAIPVASAAAPPAAAPPAAAPPAAAPPAAAPPAASPLPPPQPALDLEPDPALEAGLPESYSASWVEEAAPPAHPAKSGAHDLEAVFGARSASRQQDPPWFRVLRTGQERVLGCLERIEGFLGATVGALHEVPLQASQRVERAEAALAEARRELATRDARLHALEERLLTSGRSARPPALAPSPAPAPAPAPTPAPLRPPAPASTDLDSVVARLVQLLRRPDSATPAPAPRPEDRLDGLRSELLAMSSEHQTLVEAHARLIDRLLSLFEDA